MGVGNGVCRRLLAVDDNRLILEVIEGHFVAQGWSVATATGVDEARAALASGTPDVIVSDIIMPKTDGWTFFEEVRRSDATASIPFVFLTVEHALPQRLRGLKAGADDYMTKPFAVEELHARIERLLARVATLQRNGSGDVLLAGSAEHLPISDLMQILALNGKNGTVRLQRAGEEGFVEFVGGRIADARAGSVRGTKALFRMLAWSHATFRLEPRDGPIAEPTIVGSTATVLMEGLIAHDELLCRKDTLPAPHTRIELAGDALKRLAGLALTPAAVDLVARSKGGITVARAMEETPFPDSQVAEAICTLLDQGVLKAADPVPTARTR